MTRGARICSGSALSALAIAAHLAAQAPARSMAPEPAVTFTKDVAPIIFNHCSSCHRPGEMAPFSLTTFADVRARGRQIATVTRARQMPPWKAEPGDYAFRGDRRLTQAHIQTIERWVADGMPQGDLAALPAPPAYTDGWQLGKPDLVVRMPEAYQAPQNGRDVYRNFVLPLNLSEDVWVKGVEYRPTARSVVHHSLFFLDTTGAARQRDAQDPQPGYSGGMGGGFGGARGLLAGGNGQRSRGGADRQGSAGGGLGGWAPGAQPRLLPDDLAFFVPKGADLILSTHFHPSGKVESEASTVGLLFAKQPPSKRFTAIQLPPAFGLLAGINIAPGQTDFAISDSFVLPIDVKAFGVSGHAHYLAKTMHLRATLPDGRTKTLLRIEDWDFGWQEQYLFDDYVTLPRGTRLDVTVTYDNSEANRRNPSTPPRAVRWGEQSTDEMGSMSLQVVAATSGNLPQLQQALAEHFREKVSAAAPLLGAILQGRDNNRRR